MIKKALAIILAAMVIAASGCNNTNPPANTTTESVAAPADAWEYEYYIEDLNYYMNQYTDSVMKFSEFCTLEDYDAAAKELDSHIDVLNKLSEIITPVGLEEYQADILTAVEYEKEYREFAKKALYYMENKDTLTPEEKEEYNQLYQQSEAFGNEYISINEAVDAAIEAAFLRMPGGEYKAYVYNVDALWYRYASGINMLFEIMINDAEGDILFICEDCITVVADFESMIVPESVKPYHDDLIEQLSIEREYILKVKALYELYNEYQWQSDGEMPAEAQEYAKELSEIYDSIQSSENDASFDAMNAACEFALAQAGQ